MACPAERYDASPRRYCGLPDLDHPFHDQTTTVTTCDRICYKRKKINLSLVFAGQTAGIKQVEDHIWLASVPAGTKRISAPTRRSKRAFPLFLKSASPGLTRSSRTSLHFSPSLAAKAAVCRVWFDWVAPDVIIVSAPRWMASAMRNSSLRALLPPVARPVQSSGLIQMRGPLSAALSRSSGSSGVGIPAVRAKAVAPARIQGDRKSKRLNSSN